MLLALSQIAKIAHELLPVFAVFATALFMMILHRKDQELQRSRTELEQKTDDAAVKQNQETISNLEQKVATDETKRLASEAALTGDCDKPSVPNADPGK